MITRMFEYVGHGSDKFWEVTYPEWNEGGTIRLWSCRWGRRGTQGQQKSFAASSPGAAQNAALGKISEKLAKGYVEVNRSLRAAPVVVAASVRPSERRRQSAAAKPKLAPAPVKSFERPKRKITLG